MTHIHNHALPFPGKDDEKYIQPMADIFKVLSDPTRIRILSLLAHEEMCVTCIADSLGMTHSAISHQLRLLRAVQRLMPRRWNPHKQLRLTAGHIDPPTSPRF